MSEREARIRAEKRLRELAAGVTDDQLEVTQRGVLAVLDLGRRWAAGDPIEVPRATGNILTDIGGELRGAQLSAHQKRQAIADARAVLEVLGEYAQAVGEIAGEVALEAARERLGGAGG